MTSFPAEAVLHWVAVGWYIVATVVLVHAVLFDRAQRVRWALALAGIGLIPHAVALGLRWHATGHGPYMMKYEVLSSNAWLAVAMLVVVLWRRPSWGAIGIIVLPVALLMVAGGLFSNPEMRELPPSLRSVWLVFHIGFAKLSAAAFLISVGSATVLLLRSRDDPPVFVRRAPGVEALDAFTVRFVGFGFIFWTVTIAAGAIWANESWGRYWGWDVIETWSLITWIAYGSLLHARRFFRLKPLPTAWASIAAFAVFVLTLLILPFLMSSLHSAYFQ